jgi:hypothetical protein
MSSLISKMLNIYFTPYPYLIYNTSTRQGNMAWAGIGLGLIDSQRLFWISNVGIMLVIYNKNIYFDFILLCICGFLYTVSFKKTIELIKYLEIER